MDVDVVIAGGGIAGLAAAAGFGALGLRVLAVDPVPAPAEDLRTTAILRPGRALLERVGGWPDAEATALRVMRLVDAPGGVTRDFDSADLGDGPFGWNLPNAALQRALAARIAGMEGVELRRGAGFAGRRAGTEAVEVALDDGSRIAARLLVGADGRDSAVRRACGIGVTTHRSGQQALVFTVAHDRPHQGVSTEVHERGGPFTLVPLADDADGRPRSAVVWMTDGREALRLRDLGDAAFAEAVNARSAGVMGRLEPVGRRQAWPIVTQVARAMTARRTALMAEAAHVLPPIGAQGFNTSLADLAALLDLAGSRPGEVGSDGWLDAYARARMGDVRLRALGIGVLNRASQGGLGPLRAWGLGLLHDLAPVRRGLMRLGLG